MRLRDVFKISKINVFRGKTRTILTVLSITIGISSVLLVSSIGSAGENLLIGEIEKMGLQGISIYKENDDQPLKASDITLLKKNFEEIEAATPMIMELGAFNFNRVSGPCVIIGIGEESTDVYNIKMLHGRKPGENEYQAKKRIAVVDDELAKKAYRRTNVVGKTISLNINGEREKFEIVAVIKSQKDGFNRMVGNNIPDFLYLPYTTLNEMRNSEDISQITLKTKADGDSWEKYATFLNKRYNVETYKSKNVSSQIEEIKSVTGLISLIITAIAGISLCVAGVGIMNSMFSSCVERKREIGVAMAIGARFSDVLLCFLTEAIIISVIGGGLGAAMGIFLGRTLSDLIKLNFVLNYKTFIIAELVSVLFGILFSLLPAIKAARLDPIIALRRE